MAQLDEQGIETRPFFYPMHSLPPYFDASGDARYPVTTRMSARGMNLPSSATLTKTDVAFIADALKTAMAAQTKRT